MDVNNKPQTFNFIREPDGRWYVDLPDWKGLKADLEMVEGADTMLEYVGNGNGQVELLMSDRPFDNANALQLIHDYSQQTGGGGIYLLTSYNGETLNQEMWLCEVTAWVFGHLPKVIYFMKADANKEGYPRLIK